MYRIPGCYKVLYGSMFSMGEISSQKTFRFRIMEYYHRCVIKEVEKKIFSYLRKTGEQNSSCSARLVLDYGPNVIASELFSSQNKELLFVGKQHKDFSHIWELIALGKVLRSKSVNETLFQVAP